MGKEKMQNEGFLSYLTVSLTLFVPAVALLACAAGPPNRFAGTLQPSAGTCDARSRAVLTRSNAIAQFTPQDGVLVLTGSFTAAGDVAASSELRSTSHAPYILKFVGHFEGQGIVGTYTTPRCRYIVSLAPAP